MALIFTNYKTIIHPYNVALYTKIRPSFYIKPTIRIDIGTNYRI